MQIEWDPDKDSTNQEKHGLSFEEAKELFVSGEEYLLIYDDVHSIVEDRFIAIGSVRDGIALVVWTEPAEDNVRIISARWATKREILLYLHYMEQS